MVFGTPAGNQAQPPAAPVPPPSKTLPFGGAGSGDAANRTVIFGMPGVSGHPAGVSPPASNPNQTMVFGAPSPVAPEAADAPRNQTMMFGRAPGKATPKVTIGAAEQAGYAAPDDNRPAEATIQVDLEALTPGPEVPTDDSGRARHDRTVLFAMHDGAQPPEVAAAPEERHNRTVLFAMNPTGPAAPGPGPAPVPEPALNQTMVFGGRQVPAVPPEATPNQTMVFGGRQAPAAPVEAPDPIDVGAIQPGAEASPSVTTAPELPNLEGELHLPPEDRFAQLRDTSPGDSDAADEAALAQMRAAANRRTTMAVIVFLVLALALAAALAWYLFGKALMGGSAAAIEAQAREVVAALRRDDDAAHAEAIARSRALLERAPGSVEAHSALVLATALAADDASGRARRDRLEAEELGRRLGRLSDRSPSRDELAGKLALAREAGTRSAAEAEFLQGSLRQETQALLQLAQARNLPTAQQLAALRARSVSLAVQGEANSLALAEEFNQKSGTRDSWADMALPEYVANGGSSYDEALRQLEAVQLRDDTFLRAYVLSARIALLRKDAPGAEAQLAKVLAFHPGHDAARQLLAWVRSHREAD
jgi:hypothetical protein